MKLGDLCRVEHGGCAVTAIVADIGPTGHYGEGSIALAKRLGINPDARRGGTDDDVTYYYYPNSSKGWPRSIGDMEEQMKELAA